MKDQASEGAHAVIARLLRGHKDRLARRELILLRRHRLHQHHHLTLGRTQGRIEAVCRREHTSCHLSVRPGYTHRHYHYQYKYPLHCLSPFKVNWLSSLFKAFATAHALRKG